MACENKPLSTASSDLFSDFLSDLNSSWRKPSYKKIKEVQHSVAMKMRKLVVNQLYGLEVCLIVDEMTNSMGSYLNFLMACYSPTGGRDLSPAMGTYFWRTVSIQEYTAIVYAKEIAKVVKELEDEGMKVSSYVSDNCSTMIATESLLHSLCGKPVTRIPCASHMLNNVLKELIKTVPEISSVWNQVHYLTYYDIGDHCQ